MNKPSAQKTYQNHGPCTQPNLPVHCPNPGSMLGLIESGSKVYVSDSQNPKRKLRYTWELVEANQTLVGINTNRTNRLLEEAINKGIIAELSDYDDIKREVNVGQKSRFDLLLRGNGQPCIVEIKSVTLKKDGKALFPDSEVQDMCGS